MSAEVESMFFRGEVPWHGLGTRVIEAPTIAEAIKQAGLDWNVNKRQLYLADGREAPAFAVERDRDGAILGAVKRGYSPLQNAEAFGFFDPLVQSGSVELETAGSLRGGRKVWVLAHIGGSNLVIGDGDEVRRYVLLSNSHDGTSAVRVGFTPIRVVCANTMAIAHDSGASKLIRLLHRGNLVDSLDKVRDILNLANQTFEATAEQYRGLAARAVSVGDLEQYVTLVVSEGKSDSFEDLSTRSKNRVNEIVGNFEAGRGSDLPTARGTWWDAYNAVSEYLSHEAGKTADRRYDNLWLGAGKDTNVRALELALRLAA